MVLFGEFVEAYQGGTWQEEVGQSGRVSGRHLSCRTICFLAGHKENTKSSHGSPSPWYPAQAFGVKQLPAEIPKPGTKTNPRKCKKSPACSKCAAWGAPRHSQTLLQTPASKDSFCLFHGASLPVLRGRAQSPAPTSLLLTSAKWVGTPHCFASLQSHFQKTKEGDHRDGLTSKGDCHQA